MNWFTIYFKYIIVNFSSIKIINFFFLTVTENKNNKKKKKIKKKTLIVIDLIIL